VKKLTVPGFKLPTFDIRASELIMLGHIAAVLTIEWN